jgi:cytidine deaminase
MNSIEIKYKILDYSDFYKEDQVLIDKAKAAMEKAHAPYSKFHVGSAVQLEDGTYYTGNNQENAAYPSGLCAERVALFAAKSQTKQPIETIAIVARNAHHQAADAFACGSCRQVMLEYSYLQPAAIRVIMGNHSGQYVVVEDVRSLLPFSFDSSTLG